MTAYGADWAVGERLRGRDFGAILRQPGARVWLCPLGWRKGRI